MGSLISGTFWSMGLIIAGALTQQLWLIGYAFVGCIITITLSERRGAMKDLMKRVLGIRTMEMKLGAVAKYLKVKFTHVPEQYRCDEIKEVSQ
jgi:hypothetical protein